MMRRSTAIVIAAALALPATGSMAATCGYWIPQSDGSSWRMCTDPQTGDRYCEVKRGGAPKRMTCP